MEVITWSFPRETGVPVSITKWAFFLSAFLAFSFPSLANAKGSSGIDFSRLVVVGDSLSAGFQNFSLLDFQQPHGYASLVAQQAGTGLILPLVAYPGAPNVLSLVSLGPPPIIGTVNGSLPAVPRENPLQQPTDLAVPGVTIAQVLHQRPNSAAVSPIDQLGNIVLGFPSPFIVAGPARTQVEQAVALQPTAVIAWAGNNDVLLPAITGDFSGLTSVRDFRASYKTLLNALVPTGAALITANIPDVTEIGYFEPTAQIAAAAGLPLPTVMSMLGVGAKDYVRLPAIKQAQLILTGQAPGPLTTCPSTTPGVGPSQIPCVLTAADATMLSRRVAAYNAVIAAEAAAHGAVLVDVHALVDGIHSQGLDVDGQQLTTDFLGGLFSFDGFHPTNTGYAVIANAFIDTINKQRKMQIPEVSVSAIMWLDPFNYLRFGGGFAQPDSRLSR